MNIIVANLIYQGIYQILILILSFITIPYTCRVLGAEGIGVYSYSYAIASYFITFANMGISIYGNREIAAAGKDRNKRSQIFCELFVLQLFFSGNVFLIYIFFIIFGSWENKLIFFIQGIYIVGQGVGINWLYVGMEKFKIAITGNLIVKIITTVLIFIMVKSPSDLIGYLLILAIGTVVGNLAVWVCLSLYVDLKRVKLKNVKKYIKPVVMLTLPSFAVLLYTQMDKIFIKLFCGLRQVGYYENAERIITIPFMAINSLSTVILPRMTRLNAEKDESGFMRLFHKILSIVVWLTMAMMFGMIGIADNFIKVYLGKEYLPCITIIMILSFTIPFKGNAEILRRGYIIPKKRDSIYIASLFIGAGVNIVANLVFIPMYGANGAALGTVIAEGSVCLIQAWKIRKEIDIPYHIKECIICFAAGFSMFLGIRKVGKYLYDMSPLFILFVQILTGITVYVVITSVVALRRAKKDLF